MKTIVIFFSVILLCTATASAQEYSLRVGIADFIESKKESTESPRIVSELSTHLGKYTFISLIERSKISSLVEEISLGQSGLVDQATAAKGSKIYGLQAIIDGTISKGMIHARVIHSETAKIIATASSPVSGTEICARKLASGIETHIAREKLRFLRNDSPEIKLEFTVESNGKTIARENGHGQMKPGDTAVFKFKSNQDGFITIIDIQPSGDIVVLYPNDFSSKNEIKADTSYSVPSPNDEFEISVSASDGTDNLIAFFTKKKVEWLNPKKLAGEGFKSVIEGEKAETARKFTITSTQLKKTEWESAAIQIDVKK